MKSNKKAFTLIELLVVIAIIGILATISVIALNNARAKSRDAKRVADVKQIQTALELYFNDMNRYPLTSEFATSLFSTSTNGTTTYIAKIPSAPTPSDGTCSNSDNSFYYTSADGTSYSLSFCIGGKTGDLEGGAKCATQDGVYEGTCSSWTCGNQISIATIAGHTCNTGAPDYDTCTYDTVQIGTQCWMKQSMNIGSYVTGATTQTNDSVLQKYCYGNNIGNCSTDGGLYQWDEAMQYSVAELARGICPDGWHIPTDAEQDTLDQYLTDSPNTCNASRVAAWDCANAGTKLKAGGTSHFEGLLAGYRYAGSFYNRGSYAFFWSSSVSGPDAWDRILDTGRSTVYRFHFVRAYGLSVRCLQD